MYFNPEGMRLIVGDQLCSKRSIEVENKFGSTASIEAGEVLTLVSASGRNFVFSRPDEALDVILDLKQVGEFLEIYRRATEDFYPCGSCGFKVFSEPPGSYEICELCGWEDDHVQLAQPTLCGGANGGSLAQYQEEALSDYPLEVTAVDSYVRDPEWRPLTSSEKQLQAQPLSGAEYFHAAVNEDAIYYWKRPRAGT